MSSPLWSHRPLCTRPLCSVSLVPPPWQGGTRHRCYRSTHPAARVHRSAQCLARPVVSCGATIVAPTAFVLVVGVLTVATRRPRVQTPFRSSNGGSCARAQRCCTMLRDAACRLLILMELTWVVCGISSISIATTRCLKRLGPLCLGRFALCSWSGAATSIRHSRPFGATTSGRQSGLDFIPAIWTTTTMSRSFADAVSVG